MSLSLLLTAEEQTALSSAVRSLVQTSGMAITTETLQSFETEAQMRYRFDHSRARASSAFASVRQQVLDAVKKPGSVPVVDFSTLSPEELQTFFSMIGATGVSALIELGLLTCVSSDDLSAIVELTKIRHGLLLSNQEFFASAS